MGWHQIRNRKHEMPKTTLESREQRLAYLLLAAPLAVVSCLILFPVLWNLWLAFHRVRLLDLRRYGWLELPWTLESFSAVFDHPDFWPSMGATLVYSSGGTVLALLMGLAAALLVRHRFRGRGMVRGLFLLPYIAPVVSMAFAWRFILDPRGVLMAALQETGLMQQPIHLLGQRPWAMISLIAFEGWRYFPFDFLFIMARLQAVPHELYEAAAIDGASPLQRFYHVTLPQLRLVLATLFLLRFMWTFNKFDDVFLVTRGSGGTRVLALQVYDFLVGRFDVGMASAMSIVLFAVLTVLMVAYFRWVVAPAEEGSP
jgi:multiple sugar transport system permease protein